MWSWDLLGISRLRGREFPEVCLTACPGKRNGLRKSDLVSSLTVIDFYMSWWCPVFVCARVCVIGVCNPVSPSRQESRAFSEIYSMSSTWWWDLIAHTVRVHKKQYRYYSVAVKLNKCTNVHWRKCHQMMHRRIKIGFNVAIRCQLWLAVNPG